MKLQILSDLHFEFHADRGTSFLESVPVLAGTAVIAGDISDFAGLVGALTAVCKKWERVIYVLGNHEAYGGSIAGSKKLVRDNKPDNLIFLDNERMVIDGVGFVGGTLWFRHCKATLKFSYLMADFIRISDIHSIGDESQKFFQLKSQIQPDDVVISHHLPHVGSIAPRYKKSQTNIYFLNDVGLGYMNGPRVWIHGHTHSACDYEAENGTRVICNPLGYPNENNDFNEKLVIEV